mgnify:CR=1 FL=1
MAVVNTFEKGPEGWCSYDYHDSIIARQNYFVLATWEERGGVDAPERPISILPFILYRNWVGEPPIDLHWTEISIPGGELGTLKPWMAGPFSPVCWQRR